MLVKFFKKYQAKASQLKKTLPERLLQIRPAAIFTSVILVTIFMGFFLPSLKFNYDIERFFSSQDSEVALYNAHKATFENENDFVLIGLKNDAGIFQKKFLLKIDSLSKTLKKFNHVEKVFSPSNFSEAIKTPLGTIQVPLIHLDTPEQYASDERHIYDSEIYTNSFFSSDKKSVSLMMRMRGGLTKQSNDSLLLALKSSVTSFGFDSFHIAGRIQTQHYYVGQMKKQMSLFAGLTGILFLVSLFIIFRKLHYVLLSFGAVIVSLVWLFGLLGLMQIPIDLMLTLLPALIFIISTSGSIHLITRFRKAYHSDIPKMNALQIAVSDTGMPNFLNAFTTVIGFASLVMIPVAPIQRFGILVALGILLSFFVNLLIIPAALKAMLLKPGIAKKKSKRKPLKLLYLAFNNPRWAVGVFVLIIFASFYFSSQIKVNNHFLDDLNPSSSLKNDLDFFENNFSGIRPFEMNIQAKDGGSILNHRDLSELDALENYLKTEYGAGFVFSPLTIVKSIYKSTNRGDQDYYKLPPSQKELNKVLKIADKQKIWNRFLPVLNDSHSIGRISGRTKDEGSLVFMERNKKLQTFLEENTPNLHCQVSGAAHLMDNANNRIATNLTWGILLAVVITTLIIAAFMGSWRLAILSLLPNVFPLILIAGLMGLAGIPLKVSTSLIFTIAYGIAVDDTIHFLNSYRMNLKKLGNKHEAVRQTLTHMWQPLLYTSMVLLSGFLIFTLSAFPSISILGYLVSGSLLAALLADLLFLPALIKA